MKSKYIADEFNYLRKEPAGKYHLPGNVLFVSEQVLELTFEIFSNYSLRKVEAGCFWYGFRDDFGNGTVQAVVVPRQINSWGNYQVPVGSMDAVSQATRDHGWKNLAQIHTHPGAWVDHSPYDDEQANSGKALSIVIPYYGKKRDSWPLRCGVLEFQNGYWHKLQPSEVLQRIDMYCSEDKIMKVDLR